MLIAPQEGNPLLAITNATGHPAIAVLTGFAWRENDGYGPVGKKTPASSLLPHCSVLWGRLYDDGRLVRLATALEAELDIGVLRPPGFDA